MDGSVSTLAPVFAAAFATRSLSPDAFLVGLAASVGAGISMGFAEALSDDGSLTGRGHPYVRGAGLAASPGDRRGRHRPHAAVPDSQLPPGHDGRRGRGGGGIRAISYIRHRYMDTPFLSAALQVVVRAECWFFLTGILIGSS